MALSDIVTFQREAYTLRNEIVRDKIDLFNEATRGGIVLSQAALGENQGSFSSKTFFQKKTTVRRRNANATTAISSLAMTELKEASVKVAAGTPELIYDGSDFLWTGRDRDTALAVFSEQMATEMFADMLGVGLKAFFAAVSAQATNFNDVSALAGDLAKFTPNTALDTAMKLGDAYSGLAAWVCNAASVQQFFGYNMANAAKLFTWGNVSVLSDSMGRPIIVTDACPIIAGAPNKYQVAGLMPGGIQLQQNADFNDASREITGNEQIRYAYQAEWSYQLGLKGFTWDIANGGSSPNDATLATATNWDKTATDKRDLAGVVLRTAI
ncbi:major capsid protein [Caudoviricetes sp.]|nr:major capsid protein [Caudoviricetes sp.]